MYVPEVLASFHSILTRYKSTKLIGHTIFFVQVRLSWKLMRHQTVHWNYSETVRALTWIRARRGPWRWRRQSGRTGRYSALWSPTQYQPKPIYFIISIFNQPTEHRMIKQTFPLMGKPSLSHLTQTYQWHDRKCLDYNHYTTIFERTYMI